MKRAKSLRNAVLFVVAIGLLAGADAMSDSAQAQVYQCPPGYYFDPAYGCLPIGYLYGPPYYIYPPAFGFGFFYGPGWRGGAYRGYRGGYGYRGGHGHR